MLDPELDLMENLCINNGSLNHCWVEEMNGQSFQSTDTIPPLLHVVIFLLLQLED